MVSWSNILDIARDVIDTLKEIGIEDCCFIGGVARKLHAYELGRDPSDIDIFCLTQYSGGAEAIKQELCQANNRFYTVRARNPRNPWNVLWWQGQFNGAPSPVKIKIDILIPGVLDLAYVHPSYIDWFNGLPCAPLDLTLLHKLKGWDDRHYSPRQDQRAKIPWDAQDIWDLLQRADEVRLNITNYRPYITDSFRDASYRRLRKFALEYPEDESLFRGLGVQLW